MPYQHLLVEPIDPERVKARILQLFHCGDVTGFERMEGGYLCQNFRVETQTGTYFLKQYRNRISSQIHEIKEAEQFFASQGIPVILPLQDVFGRSVFLADRNWFSLFPFINQKPPAFGSLNEELLSSLGSMLGRIHQAGKRIDHEHFQPLRLGDKSRFMIELVELRHELESREERTELEERMRALLETKLTWVNAHETNTFDQELPFDTLLHGDFLYQNVFTDSKGAVTHVYDWEKTCNGPRAFELARSLIINAFDDGWESKNFQLARAFLQAYREINPIDISEIIQGIRIYTAELMQMTWLEGKYIIHGIDTQLPIYQRHANRVEWLGEHLEEFCQRISLLELK